MAIWMTCYLPCLLGGAALGLSVGYIAGCKHERKRTRWQRKQNRLYFENKKAR